MSTYQPTYHSDEVVNKLWQRLDFCSDRLRRLRRCSFNSEAYRYWHRQDAIATWQMLSVQYREPIPSDEDCIIALGLF